MIERNAYKIKLEDIVASNPSILKNSLLNMYYLAGKNRLTSFFLLDYFDRLELLNILDKNFKNKQKHSKLNEKVTLFQNEIAKISY
ncbi:hypothetical protein DID75_00680 [Candidatus Marinamargulisbacteria bacterium SCGC AG-410-N11]|nr:hypothetical protein DID75_00680 [Candidatus Marinamargulisbacteria bacterium SCGC AG-410-N11]